MTVTINQGGFEARNVGRRLRSDNISLDRRLRSRIDRTIMRYYAASRALKFISNLHCRLIRDNP